MKYSTDYQTGGRNNFGTQTRLTLTKRTQGWCSIYIYIYIYIYIWAHTNVHTYLHTYIYIYIYIYMYVYIYMFVFNDINTYKNIWARTT